MVTKKVLLTSILTTFCLLSVLFMTFPTRSASEVYDPWADVSGPTIGEPDGTINMRDIQYEIMLFNTHGTPINRTQIDKTIEFEQLLENIIYNKSYDGLVGYWKLDEGTGNVTLDSSGNNNTGIFNGDPTWVDGKYGKALNFDGTDDFVSINDSASLRVQSFSIVAWIYMTVRPYQAGHPGHNHVCIVNKMYYMGPNGTTGYKLDFVNPTDIDDTLIMTIGNGTGQQILVEYNSINDLTLNQWHQITGTYNGSTAKLYIDGQLKRTGQGSYTILHDNIPLCFSREVSQPGFDGFNGIIDNVMLYNRSLSAEEAILQYLFPPP